MLKFCWAWSCEWSTFSLHKSFIRTQDTKRFTVPFTRFGRDNKSVSVCVPAIVYTCAHMPLCVCVRAQPLQMCLRDSSLFTRRCSWCLASGPCHDPWHCHWLTSRTHCARQAPSRFFLPAPCPPPFPPPSLPCTCFFSLHSTLMLTYINVIAAWFSNSFFFSFHEL